MPRLSELMAGFEPGEVRGDASAEIRGVTYDSRRVEIGFLFAALPGTRADGRTFVPQALERGAAAVLCAPPAPEGIPESVAVVLVDDPRTALGLAAAAFHGHPARELAVVGVTGTNGKTTVAYLIEAMGTAAMRSVGVTGTVSYRFGATLEPASVTTPESADLQAIYARMLRSKIDIVVSEVSSHALAQNRVAGVDFSVAAFTNLSQDHLDYHGDLDSYAAAKQRLFTQYLAASRGPARAVFCVDDETGTRFAEEYDGEMLTCSGRVGGTADVAPTQASFSTAGIDAVLATPAGEVPIRSMLLGQPNLQNLAVATAVALALELPVEAIKTGALTTQVPGRLQRVDGGPPNLTVLVDYAHTPAAIDIALAAMRPLTEGRLIAVFGCGGDRDRGKRRLMGEAAGRRADLVVVTSDNPRTEEPQAIIEQITPGLDGLGVPRVAVETLETGRGGESAGIAGGYVVIPDRREAIRAAVSRAQPGDVVAILGKGHEDYQIHGTTKVHFDDREEAQLALRQRETN